MQPFRRFLTPRMLLRATLAPGKAIARQSGMMRRGLVRAVTPRQLRSREGRTLFRFLGRTEAQQPSPLTAQAPGLEPLEEAPPEQREGDRGRLPGPPTIIERRMRLDPIVAQQLGDVGRIAYRTNTIVIVDRGSLLARLLNKIKNLLLAVPAMLAAYLQLGSGAGRARLGKRIVVVNRRGDITVYDV